MAPKTKKCPKCNNCDAIHTSVVNDSVSSCPSGIQLCAACINVGKLKSEVEETMERLRKLLQDLQHAKTDMNHSHSAISKQLPAEILYSVFESYASEPAAPGDWCETFNQSFRREKMARPTVLSQVCTQWRQVALATPRILTTIMLRWDVSAEEETDRVREWTSRTRGFPMDVYMYSSAGGCYYDSSPHIPLLYAIASTSAQWRYFTALAPDTAGMQMFNFGADVPVQSQVIVLEYLGRHVNDLGLLEELNISRGLFSQTNPQNPIWEHYQPAPKSVELYRNLPPNKMNIQWNAVTTMKVTYITTEQCLMLLSSASDLKTCTFENIELEALEERSWHINRPAIKHAKIQNFTCTSSCLFLFYRLELPNLRTFACNWTNLEGIPEVFFESILDLKVLNILHIFHSGNAETLRSTLSKVPGTVAELFFTCYFYYYKLGDINGSDPRQEILRVFDQTAPVLNPDSDINRDTDSGLPVVLPSLTSLEILTDVTKFPWKGVPKCFALPCEDSPADQNTPRRRRPLSRFRVTDWSIDKREQVLIPADVLKELMVLQHQGAEIIFKREDGDDLFARSIVDAGLDKN